MKKRRLELGTLILGILLLGSCAHMFTKGGSDFRAGDKAFNEKKYDNAVIHALKALEVNPEFEDARALLDKAFKTGTSSYESTIAQKKATSEPFRWDIIWHSYFSLDRMHRAMAASPYSGEYSTKPYAAPLGEARENAAAERYAAGVETLAKGGFRNARIALGHFNKANEAVPNYQDLNEQIAQAKQQAIAKVMVTANTGRYAPMVETLKEVLSSQEGWATFATARADHSLERAQSQFSSDYDFLIFLSVRPDSKVIGPQSEKGLLVEGGKPTQNTTVGYEKSYAVTAKLVDLSSGSEIASKSYTGNGSDSMNFSWLGWERKEKLNLTTYGGDLHYNITDMTAAEYQAMQLLMSKARGLVLNKTPEDITAMTSFADLKKNFNGSFVIRGAEVIAHPMADGSIVYQPTYTGTWAEHSGYSTNASRLYDALANHGKALAQRASADFAPERSAAAKAIAAAFKGKM